MKIITILFLFTVASPLFAKSFILKKMDGLITVDTDDHVTRAIIRTRIECLDMNIVVGPVTISEKLSVQEIFLGNDGETLFFTDKQRVSCFSLITKRWFSAKVSIYFPELKRGISHSYNKTGDFHTKKEMNKKLQEDIEEILLSETVPFY